MLLHHLLSKFISSLVLLLSITSLLNDNNLNLMIVSASEFKCFKERDELKDAIDSCFKGGEGAVSEYGTTVKISANEKDCNKVKATYGWPMNGWCTGDVTNMHFLFSGKRDFNEDISDWNTSSNTDFYETFSFAESFNGDLSKWDVSNVITMYGMFNGVKVFNTDISLWKTNSLNETQWMFYDAPIFNGDLSKWNMSGVTNMWEMFSLAKGFDGDVSTWDTSKVEYFEGCFDGASSFNGDVSKWDTSSALTMKEMFMDALIFNQDVSNWKLPKHVKLDSMFKGARSFNQNLCKWKDTFPYDHAKNIFKGSGCRYADGPPLKKLGGPFCASDCGGVGDFPTYAPTADEKGTSSSTTTSSSKSTEAETDNTPTSDGDYWSTNAEINEAEAEIYDSTHNPDKSSSTHDQASPDNESPDTNESDNLPHHLFNKEEIQSMASDILDDMKHDCSSTECRSIAAIFVLGAVIIVVMGIRRVIARRNLMSQYQEAELEITDLTLDDENYTDATDDHDEREIYTIT